MKTRGIQNAINRLNGARRLGSSTLLARAEQEAEQILVGAKAWLERRAAPPPGQTDERYTPIALATEQLQQALDDFRRAAP